MVDGAWRKNITCSKCRQRHPADLACAAARGIAAKAAAVRMAEACAAADELRDQVTAGAKMIAERDQQIAKLKAEISKMKNNLHK